MKKNIGPSLALYPVPVIVVGAMVDGKLAFGPCASLLFCVAFVIIMISISIKQRNLAKEEAAEDDM